MQSARISYSDRNEAGLEQRESMRTLYAKAWIVAIATIFAGIALALVQNKVAPAISTIQLAFGIDMATAGWMSSLFSLVGIVMAIPASFVLKKLGAKKGGIIALACAILGSLIGLLTRNITILLISRVVEGVGVGLIGVIGPSIIAMWFPPEKRGLPMSIWAAYQMGAQAVMFFLGDALTTSFGWQGMWWFGLVACALSLVLFAACIKSPPSEFNYADIESDEVAIGEGIKTPGAWALSLSTMFFCIACFGFVNWIAICWTQILEVDSGVANMWVGYFSLGGVIAAVVVGALLNRIKNRKLFGGIILVLYGIVSIWGMTLGDPRVLFLFVIIYPIVDAGFPCVLWTMAAQTVRRPELAGVALGVVNIGFNVGILLGPPIIGAIADAAGWQTASWAICACCVVSALCLVFVKLYQDNRDVQDAS